jgi:hypothetical protein
VANVRSTPEADICRALAHVRFGPILLQKDFCPWSEEWFSRSTAEWRISIHRTAHSDFIIAEFPWSGSRKGTFATKSAMSGSWTTA